MQLNPGTALYYNCMRRDRASRVRCGMRAIARGSAARADEGDLEGELYHTISISICTVGGGEAGQCGDGDPV